MPPSDFSNSFRKSEDVRKFYSVEIGNPAEKNNPGNVTLSGYIYNKDTKEPVSGVTVFIQKLSAGTISNEYGFYTLTIPRGVHLAAVFFHRNERENCESESLWNR